MLADLEKAVAENMKQLDKLEEYVSYKKSYFYPFSEIKTNLKSLPYLASNI